MIFLIVSITGFFTSLCVYLGTPLVAINIAAVLVLALGMFCAYVVEEPNLAIPLILSGVFVILLSIFIYLGTPLLVINITCGLVFLTALIAG